MPQRHGCQRNGDIVHVFERQGFDQRPGQGDQGDGEEVAGKGANEDAGQNEQA